MIKKKVESRSIDEALFGFYVVDGQALHTVFDDELQAPVTETLSREDILASIAEDQHYLDNAAEFDMDEEQIAFHKESIAESRALLDQIA